MNETWTLALWVLGTLAVGMIGAQVSQRSLAARIWANGLVGELILFIYRVGIPFAALILGVLGQDLIGLGRPSPGTLLGFSEPAWVSAAVRAGLAVSAIGAVLWLMGREQPQSANDVSAWVNLRDTLYDQAHWAFYFSAGTLWLNDAYWGVLIGIVLAVLEIFVHPRFRARLSTQHGRQRLLVRCLCLLTGGLLYAGPQNLWLMLLADAVIRLTSSHLLQPARQSQLQP